MGFSFTSSSCWLAWESKWMLTELWEMKSDFVNIIWIKAGPLNSAKATRAFNCRLVARCFSSYASFCARPKAFSASNANNFVPFISVQLQRGFHLKVQRARVGQWFALKSKTTRSWIVNRPLLSHVLEIKETIGELNYRARSAFRFRFDPFFEDQVDNKIMPDVN